jgi:hypothetical protein
MSEAVWRLHPNGGRIASLAVDRDYTERLLERGWLSVNGCRALVIEVLDREPLTGMDALRIQFEEPYPWPHP